MGDQGRAPRTITLSIKSLVGVLLVAAAVAGGFVVNDLMEEQRALEQDVEELNEVVESQRTRIDGALQDLEAAGTEALVPLRRRVTTIAACLPEIQAQLNTLEVDFGFAFPSDSPSARCRGLLYGDTAQVGE
jgi:uncharacterized membrane protein YccC